MVELIESGWSHYCIIGCSVVGLVWGGVNTMLVSLRNELMLLASPPSCALPWHELNASFLISLGQQSRAR